MSNNIPAVELVNITKTFGRVHANTNVCMKIHKGEIVALLGENGSGKTTLMNMLSGIYYPDSGAIFIDGKEASIRSPKDAFSYKIGMVHQHFKLVDVLTATENIILGLEGKLNLKESEAKITEICEKYGFDVDPKKKIYDMTVSEKQTVEIVKVLYRGADILILDEPTAVLTPQETEKLFNVMRKMKEDNKALIIITHKLHEVEAISDRVAILRKGEYIADLVTKDTNAQEMTDMMVGHAVKLNIERVKPLSEPKTKLVVKNLTVVDSDGIKKVDDVNFEVKTGEILGIAGISGCGQKELLESIAGLQDTQSGSSVIYINDDGTEDELIGLNPYEISRKGVSLSFVPEDRLGMGLVANMDISDNMMLRSFRQGPTPFTDRKSPYKLAKKVVSVLDVATPSIETPVRKLSGGNVQKVLVGREISNAPTVLMTAYAVRGLDINSSYAIYDLINEQKKKNVAVIFVGEDLDVLLELCDRILVLCDGKVSGVVEDPTPEDKNTVGLLMTKVGGNNSESK